MKGKLLLADDEPTIRETLKLVLEKEGYAVKTAHDGKQALDMLQSEPFDLLLTDLRMPKMSGIQVIRQLNEKRIDVEVVVITAYADVKDAVEAIKLGAFDYLEKTFTPGELLDVVARAVEKRAAVALRAGDTGGTSGAGAFYDIVSDDPKIKEVIAVIKKIAGSRASVLITGESGTGKELFAKAIHYLSPRRDFPFVPINCAAIPENLLESELFGHEKGAFTGAVRQKKGKFEMADKGTVFLDEVGEMSPHLQGKLLRVLQDKAYERVGGLETIHVDIRFIAATNRDLHAAMRRGVFREDLFYRLNVVTLDIPPLRKRRGDIPLLARYFLKRYNDEYGKSLITISARVMERFMAHDWLGNVRELKNTIERAVAVADAGDTCLELKHLPPGFAGKTGMHGFYEGMSLAEMEKYYILSVLDRVGWNKTKAAAVLKINRQTLYNKIREYGLAEFNV